jgi:concanavalin A-like lectin/glucanase superfamily protein
VAVVQSGTPSTPAQTTSGTGTVITSASATWGTGQNRVVGNLLVAIVTAYGSTSAAATAQYTGTSGWTKVQEFVATACVSAVWTKTATGGDAIPRFSSSISGTSARTRLSIMLLELTDSINPGSATPVVDTYNTSGTGTSGTLTVTTSANLASSIGYAVAVECATSGATGSNTWGASGSWTNSFTDAASAYSHWVNAVYASPPSGATLSYAPTHTITSTYESGVVVAFKPGQLTGASTMSGIGTLAAAATVTTFNVQFDARGPSNGTAQVASGGPATSPLTWAHIAAPGAALLVWVVVDAVTQAIGNPSATYGGTAMTRLAMMDAGGAGSNSGFLTLFGLASAGNGASQTVSVSFGASGIDPDVVDGGSVSYTGAAPTTAAAFGTPVTQGDLSGTLSITLASTSSKSMVAAANANGGSATGGMTAGTLREAGGASSAGYCGELIAGDSPGTGSNVTLTFSGTGSSNARIAVEVLPPASDSYDTAIASDSPVAYWRLNEPAGADGASDTSGYSRGAVPTGVTFGTSSPALPGGMSGTSASFDGATSYLKSTWDGPASSPLSFEFWANANGQTQTTNYPGFVSQGNPSSVLHGWTSTGSYGALQGGAANGSAFASVVSGAIPASGWFHVVVTYDGTTITLYYNGSSIGTPATLTGPMLPNTGAGIAIGVNQTAFWKGLIAKVAVYNYALTGTQVLAHYNAGGAGAVTRTATMSGSGTLGGAPALVWTAALSGAGTLSAAPVRAGAAALSGAGTLTAGPAIGVPATLSGLGSLSAAPALGISAALSGSGSLVSLWTFGEISVLSGVGSLGAAPILAAIAALTGLGTLTSAPVRAAVSALTGLGTLSAAPIFAPSAALTGLGTLSATPIFVGTASLTGLGTLTAGWTFGEISTLSGVGTLTSSITLSSSVTLSGIGTLSGYTYSAQLTGVGTLTAGLYLPAASALGGLGKLTAAWTFGEASTMSGVGTLIAYWTFGEFSTLSGVGTITSLWTFGEKATLTGIGTIGTSPYFVSAAVLSGVGTLTPLASFVGAVALTGLGTLSAAPVFATVATLSGVGSLTAYWGQTAQLAGVGTLSAASTIGTTATFTGLGTLSAAASLSLSVSLTGIGVLTAGPIFVATAGLSGRGTLTAAPAFSPSSTFTGLGTLTAQISLAFALSGSGTLTAAVSLLATSTLSGQGTLSATAVAGAVAFLSGQGTLTSVAFIAISATFVGAGTLTAAPVQFAVAILSGVGTLSAAITFVASLTGRGTLSALPAFTPLALMSGSGTLALTTAILGAATLLTGIGTLSGAVFVGYPFYGTLSGIGTLRTVAYFSIVPLTLAVGVSAASPQASVTTSEAAASVFSASPQASVAMPESDISITY